MANRTRELRLSHWHYVQRALLPGAACFFFFLFALCDNRRMSMWHSKQSVQGGTRQLLKISKLYPAQIGQAKTIEQLSSSLWPFLIKHAFLPNTDLCSYTYTDAAAAVVVVAPPPALLCQVRSTCCFRMLNHIFFFTSLFPSLFSSFRLHVYIKCIGFYFFLLARHLLLAYV